MQITKFGHCCLLVEHNTTRILTDPGEYSTGQDVAKNIDAILITHEHGDHCHIASIKKILVHNPQVRILTNHGVGKLLDAEKIKYELVEHGQSTKVKTCHVEGHGDQHAVMHPSIPTVQNTGYTIDSFYYPGDALFIPKMKITTLALPVAGPWLKLSDAIDFAWAINPKHVFPVHDAVLSAEGLAVFYRITERFLGNKNIPFTPLRANETKTFD
jgi:L-ascorbate metabolism protein UlaG (beta-lactamase superfamily)